MPNFSRFFPSPCERPGYAMATYARSFALGVRRKWLAQLAVAVALVALAATQMNPKDFVLAFSGIRYEWLAAAVLVYLAGRLLNAWEWQILIMKVGHAPLFGLLGVLLIGTLVNTVFPANLGDVAKIQIAANRYSLSRAGLVAGRGAEAVVNGAIFACFVLVTVALLGGIGAGTLLWALAPALALFIAAVLATRAMPEAVPRDRMPRVIPVRWRESIEHHWPRFHDGLEALRHGRVLLRLGLLGLIGWVIDIAINWAYGTAFDLHLPLSSYVLLAVVFGVITTFPITFGNVGSWEFGIVGVLALYGVPADRALAFGVATHVLIAALNLVAGSIAVGLMRVSPSDLFALRSASVPSVQPS